MRQRRFLIKDGYIMAVVRPADPELAKRLSEECLHSGLTGDASERAFNAFLAAQEYTFVGIAEQPQHKQKGLPRLLDRKTREVIGTMRAWDSFMRLDDLDMLSELSPADQEAAKAIADAALVDAKKPEEP